MHTIYHATNGRTAILTALDDVETDDMWGTTETVAVLTIGDEKIGRASCRERV